MSGVRPPFDPELLEPLRRFKQEMEFEPLTAATLHSYRSRFAAREVPLPELIGDRPVTADERVVPGPAGAPDITVLVLRPADGGCSGAGIYHIHGGGTVLGSRITGLDALIDYVAVDRVVLVSVEYRLAPENPHPGPVEDCYAGLVWMAGHAEQWGVDPHRILVAGASAGGGLSAAVALLARDRGGPALAGQCLMCPMLDDRNDSVSALQFDPQHGPSIWDRGFNDTGWSALLGADRRGGPDVSPYAAPARAVDLAGLPPAFIDAGSCEVFRDEDIAYAARIWAAGGQAELHVWAGAFHGFSGFAPEAAVSRAAVAARDSWVRRTLGLPQPLPPRTS